jgi:hypothetical protein
MAGLSAAAPATPAAGLAGIPLAADSFFFVREVRAARPAGLSATAVGAADVEVAALSGASGPLPTEAAAWSPGSTATPAALPPEAALSFGADAAPAADSAAPAEA